MSLSAAVELVWSYVDLYTIAVLFAVYWLTKFVIWHGYLFSGKKLLPGFYGFPLVDVLPYFLFGKETMFERLESLSKKYGPVIRFRRSTGSLVVVTGVEAVREGMMNDDLLGRPPNRPLGDDNIFTKTVLNTEGDIWKKHRRFSLITLRDLGFGKTAVMEERIQTEVRDLMRRLDAEGGEPFNIQPALVESTAHNINSLVFGGKFDEDKSKKKKVYEIMTAVNREQENISRILFIPYAMKIMQKLNLGVIKKIKVFTKSLATFITGDIQSHREDLDRENPRDCVDHYLIEQEKDEDFTEELVIGNAVAFFFAGSGTVRLTLEFLFQLMAKYPEVQHKVQACQSLPYTMAVIAERHRYFTIVPAGVPRRVMRPTKLCGYDLQANDEVVFNIDSVHYDREQFENPYEFRPEHFLDIEGKLVNIEKVWSFSIGKRACPGESLAVLELFMYFAMVLQNFNIEADGPVKCRPLRSLISEVIAQDIRFVRRT